MNLARPGKRDHKSSWTRPGSQALGYCGGEIAEGTVGNMSGLDRRKFGFWYILLEQKNPWPLLKWEGVSAIIIGVGGGIEVIRWTKVDPRVAVAGDFLVIVPALLGVVLAAFALIVAFLSDSYTLQLQKNPKGVRAFFAPFMINIGVDVGLVIATVAYRAVATHLPHTAEHVYFVVIATLFVYALLNIVALARAFMAHGVTHAELIELEQLEREAGHSLDRGN